MVSPIEEIRVVFKGAANSGRLVPHIEIQIEHRGGCGDLEFRAEWRVLKNEGHLEDGRVRHRPFGAKSFDKFLEGEVFVRLRFEHDFAHALNQFLRAWRAGEIGAQNERADEKADQILELRPGPIGQWSADENVGMAAVAIRRILKIASSVMNSVTFSRRLWPVIYRRVPWEARK